MDSSVTIPDHAATDTWVMDFNLNDDDIGDWFTKYQMVDNDLFYIDTEKGNKYYSL